MLNRQSSAWQNSPEQKFTVVGAHLRQHIRRWKTTNIFGDRLRWSCSLLRDLWTLGKEGEGNNRIHVSEMRSVRWSRGMPPPSRPTLSGRNLFLYACFLQGKGAAMGLIFQRCILSNCSNLEACIKNFAKAHIDRREDELHLCANLIKVHWEHTANSHHLECDWWMIRYQKFGWREGKACRRTWVRRLLWWFHLEEWFNLYRVLGKRKWRTD